MKRLTTILICSILIGNITIEAQSARQYYKAGEEYSKKKQYEAAVEQFTIAINLDPDYDKAYIGRAEVLSHLKEYDKSISDYDRASVFNEKDETLFYAVGKLYHRVGNNPEALVRLNKAINLKSNYLAAYQERSKVLMEMELYTKALLDCQKCLKLDSNAEAYYNLAKVYETLEMYYEAEIAYRKAIEENRNIKEAHFGLANMLYGQGNIGASLRSVNYVLILDPTHLEALILQSKVFAEQLYYSKAIETLSIASIKYPEEPRLFLARGEYYSSLNQLPAAILDYSRVIELDPNLADVYIKRGRAYEKIRDYERASKDYMKLLEMSKYDGEAQRMYDEVVLRMYELYREDDKPEVKLMEPMSKTDNSVDVPRGTQVMAISGIILDASEIKTLQVNNYSVPLVITEEGYQFLASVNLRDSDQITVNVTDVYDNAETAIFTVRWTEVDPPTVRFNAPYGSANNILYLDEIDGPYLMEGRIEDESKIVKIFIDSVSAGYNPNDINPSFSAMVRVDNKTTITVTAEDVFGNISATQFTLKRNGPEFNNNPMGKTWAIFIANSEYSSFANLAGPAKDISLMKRALEPYQINNIIELKNATKKELVKFFAIDLRDLIRSNKVNSILIWYAGHGKYLNNTGYWIPTDAKRDEEITYFDTKAMKASMQSYSNVLQHTLVVTDACESGPSFYQAMRSDIVIRDCNDIEATSFKSSQVFSSAGYELATDDSQFTRTFASSLANSSNLCVPIERIVLKVTSAVENRNQQKPQFGRIADLEDENGTFFFIPKSYE